MKESWINGVQQIAGRSGTECSMLAMDQKAFLKFAVKLQMLKYKQFKKRKISLCIFKASATRILI